MFKYHQKHYDISKYFNATLVQPVKSRAVTSKYQMKSYFHFLPRCEQRAQTGQRAPGKERVCARGQPLAGWIPTPKNDPLKSWIFLKRSIKPKKAQDNFVFSLFWVSYLSFVQRWDTLCLKRMRQTLCENIFHTLSSHSFPILLSPCLRITSAPALHFVLFTKEAFSDLPLILLSLRVLVYNVVLLKSQSDWLLKKLQFCSSLLNWHIVMYKLVSFNQ